MNTIIPTVSASAIACAPGLYRLFTGYVCWRGTEGFVENAAFTIKDDSACSIIFHEGTWLDGTLECAYVSDIDWMNGIFANGMFHGVWHDGIFRNGLFSGHMWCHGHYYGNTFVDAHIEDMVSYVDEYSTRLIYERSRGPRRIVAMPKEEG